MANLQILTFELVYRTTILSMSLFIRVKIMKKIIFFCLLCFSTLSFAELGSSIFRFDGQDFIRTDTTLIDENGNPAINTKMDRNYPGFKALLNKKSYNGRIMLFGRLVDSKVAPLTDENGNVIGALAVFRDVD
jgi:hypothetical protein